jgi:hypothetical protein
MTLLERLAKRTIASDDKGNLKRKLFCNIFHPNLTIIELNGTLNANKSSLENKRVSA